MRPLFVPLPLNDRTEYQNFSQSVSDGEPIALGTPGTLEERERDGATYYYRRFYDPSGKPREEYIGGPSGDSKAEARLDAFRSGFDQHRMRVEMVKRLRKLGYQCAEDRAGATLATLHNAGAFQGGLTLIGTYAYGTILNELGIATMSSMTEEIDLIRSRPLHLAGAERRLLDILKQSFLPFIEVSTGLTPGFSAKTIKLPGSEKLLVDLLVDGDPAGKAVPVPELGADAQALPHMDFLSEQSMRALILSKNHVVPVRVPTPERFAVHKMFSSQSRTNQFAKSDKDLLQAATLIGALDDLEPGNVEEAMRAFPASGQAPMLRGARKVVETLKDRHARAADHLGAVIDNLAS